MNDDPKRRGWRRSGVLTAGGLAALLVGWWALDGVGVDAPSATPAAASADRSYAGLGGAADDGFATPERDRALVFPDDLGPHPSYRIEWWYVTANLRDADGGDYGVQWTLFRQATAPPPQRDGWASQQVWLGHAAATSADRHFAAERWSRGGVGQAGAHVRRPGDTADVPAFEAWIDHWRFTGLDGGVDAAPTRYALEASGDDFDYALELASDAPFALQGERGYSVKSELGQASYYFSQPHFEASGVLTLGGDEIEVTGHAWMDREWSSQPLAPGQTGWDWFSLHFQSGPHAGAKAMLFRLRQDPSLAPEGAALGGDYLSGNWITPDGVSSPLDRERLSLTPLAETEVAGRLAPTRWRIEIAEKDLSLTAEAVNPTAWNGLSFAYWEGPVRLDDGALGVGFLEMTGY